MNIEHLDDLFQEYGYDVKERNASYRVYLLNQGMYHGAEIQIMDDGIDATRILERYSKLDITQNNKDLKLLNRRKIICLTAFLTHKLP